MAHCCRSNVNPYLARDHVGDRASPTGSSDTSGSFTVRGFLGRTTLIYSRNPKKRSPPTGVRVNQHHTCSSAVGGYSPGFRDGRSIATGAPFEGTSEAIPAAAETGFGAGVLRDSSAPAALAVLVFTNELVPETRSRFAGVKDKCGQL